MAHKSIAYAAMLLGKRRSPPEDDLHAEQMHETLCQRKAHPLAAEFPCYSQRCRRLPAVLQELHEGIPDCNRHNAIAPCDLQRQCQCRFQFRGSELFQTCPHPCLGNQHTGIPCLAKATECHHSNPAPHPAQHRSPSVSAGCRDAYGKSSIVHAAGLLERLSAR